MAQSTLHDVAARAGVSLTTTSMILSGKGSKFSAQTQERVRIAAADLGYERNSAAVALRTGCSDHIAILMPAQHNNGIFQSLIFDSPFFADFISGFEFVATSRNIPFILNRIFEPSQLKTLTRALRPKAALVLGTMPENIMSIIGVWDIPTVVIDNPEGCKPYQHNPHLVDYSLNDSHLGFLGMEHLLSQGHRRIVLLFGKLSLSNVHQQRYSGAMAALKQLELNGVEIELIETVDISFKAVELVAEQLFSAIEKGTTAILCMADILALGCYTALTRHNLNVPQDISLCGIDGLQLLNYLPYQLSTVDQRIVERGMQVARLLLGEKIDFTIQPIIRLGETVAFCKN